MSRQLRVATRGSRLALRQVALVAELLGIEVEPVVVSTDGDRHGHVPLRTIAGHGAFTGDVRTALAQCGADIAVHSAKDLPPRADPRFDVAYPVRADARDILVGATLGEIPTGGTVATGAPRRRAQLAALRSDLQFAELRGNIDTRLAKATEFSAIIVAAAALERLGIVPDAPTHLLPIDEFVPQVGQGVLAVEARAEDRAAHRLLEAIDDHSTRLTVTAERAFLATLGGDCDLPAGAHATVDQTGALDLSAVIADGDGRLIRCRATGIDPEAAGVTAAETLEQQLGSTHVRTRTVA